jgi:hypothetical protein
MTFEPENPLEKALVRATGDVSTRPEFYRLLMASNIFAIGKVGRTVPRDTPARLDKSDRLSLATVRSGDRSCHPAFTSLTRLDAFLTEKRDSFCLVGRDLFETTRGAPFVLNPGSQYGKLLEPDELAYWLDQLVGRRLKNAPEAIVAPPQKHPVVLAKALGVLFVNRQVSTARLAEIRRAGAVDPARLVLAVECDGNWRKLAREIGEAVEAAAPGLGIELVRLNSADKRDRLGAQLLAVAPFYARSQFLEAKS